MKKLIILLISALSVGCATTSISKAPNNNDLAELVCSSIAIDSNYGESIIAQHLINAGAKKYSRLEFDKLNAASYRYMHSNNINKYNKDEYYNKHCSTIDIS